MVFLALGQTPIYIDFKQFYRSLDILKHAQWLHSKVCISLSLTNLSSIAWKRRLRGFEYAIGQAIASSTVGEWCA